MLQQRGTQLCKAEHTQVHLSMLRSSDGHTLVHLTTPKHIQQTQAHMGTFEYSDAHTQAHWSNMGPNPSKLKPKKKIGFKNVGYMWFLVDRFPWNCCVDH